MRSNPRFRAVKSILIAGVLCVAPATFATDTQRLALSLQAQTDFDRVQRASAAELTDTTRCEQSLAAWLPVAPRTEIAAAHFRMGYCELAGATITHRPEDFLRAAAEFRKTVEAPVEPAPDSRNHIRPTTVSSALVILETVAHLEAAPGANLEQARQQLATAVDPPVCAGSFLPFNHCRILLKTGAAWLGWIDLQQEDPDRAAQDLASQPNSAWAHWAAGEQAFRDRRFADAAARYREAIEKWQQAEAMPRSLDARLEPQPDWAGVLADWGGSQLLSGDAPGAISTLNAAVKSNPQRGWALYLRALAEDHEGDAQAALADYSLASRTAMAGAQDLASGEAHLYRGIMLFRRKDFAHAENEFASALNFEIPAALRPDAVAWRHMAAVAGGSCSASSRPLEDSLGAVSPYFPKQEARTLASSCPLSGSGI